MKKLVFSQLIFAVVFCSVFLSNYSNAAIEISPENVTLFAGQTNDAGEVLFAISDDEKFLLVSFVTGWQVQEAHLWVGSNLSDMPQNKKGNPIPGQFPNKYPSGNATALTNNGYTTVSFSISLESLGFECDDNNTFYVAAHATLNELDELGIVLSTESAWSAGTRMVEKGNWATYTEITLTCVEDQEIQEIEYRPETAFAYSDEFSTCFIDIDEDGNGKSDFNRWGWTVGPLSENDEDETYLFPLYAGAGQCDISKGTHVGNLIIKYSDGDVTADYVIIDENILEEAQFYVGNEILPQVKQGKNTVYTVAPGQYPEIANPVDSETGHTFTITGLSGDIYVVAHATVLVPVN